MKPLINTILILGAIGCFFLTDAQKKTMEVGIVTYKFFAPPGQYHPVKYPPPHLMINVLQPAPVKSYNFKVTRKDWNELENEDRVPIKKTVGRWTGIEYKVELDLQ